MRLQHVAAYLQLESRKTFRRLSGEVGRALLSPQQIKDLNERHNFRFTREDLLDADGSPKKIKDAYLELRSRCNSTCGFCLANLKTDTRPDVAMTMVTFRRIVDELKAMGSDGYLNFHCMSEPLLHPQIVEFVSIASEELPAMTTRILTNGKKLTVGMARRLADTGVKKVQVSTYLERLTDPLPKNLQTILAEVDRYRSDTDPWFASWQWGETHFQIERQQETAVRENLGGHSPNAAEVRGQYWGFCEFPFRAVAINPEGKIAKCPWDFGFSDAIGDLASGPIDSQWRNGPLQAVREKLSSGVRDGLTQCTSCNFNGGCRRNTRRTFMQRVAAHLVPTH